MREEREFVGFFANREAKRKLRVLAAAEGVPMSEFLRKAVEERVQRRQGRLEKVVEGMAK